MNSRLHAVFDAVVELASIRPGAAETGLEEVLARRAEGPGPRLPGALGALAADPAAGLAAWGLPVLDGVLSGDVAGALEGGPEALRALVEREVRRARVPASLAAELAEALPGVLRRLAERVRYRLGPAAAHTGEGRLEAAPRHPDLVGASPRMERVFEVVERVAASGLAVLFRGESGTGKEVLARSLHRASPRGAGPFVAIPCGALAPDLADSELFGHLRGAFTGAERDAPGLLRGADGGTVFLDEVDDLPLPVQAKLLRVLQQGELRPVGAESVLHVDLRVVAATHRDLEAAMALGSFRRDLYYRLAQVVVEIPPLRERPEDVPLLVEHLLRRHGGDPARLDPLALRCLTDYPWPGNVRELEAVLRHALAMASGDGGTLRDAHLPERLRAGPVASPRGDDYASRLAPREREVLLSALVEHDWNVTRTAGALALSRRTLQRHLKRLGLERELERRRGPDPGGPPGRDAPGCRGPA